MRYLCIDFETNGLPHERLRPCAAFPTQVSVDVFDPAANEVVHLYDSFICGAVDLSEWVLKNTPVTHELLTKAPSSDRVASELAELWCDGDVLVAHNAQFDLGKVLPLIAEHDHPFLTAPRICTKTESWGRKAVGKVPSLKDLCAHLKVEFDPEKAHDATYDTYALASLMQAAHSGEQSWSVKLPLVKGDSVEKVTFGRHKGESFQAVFEEDPSYCRWLLRERLSLPNARRFVAWIEKQGD
jgi:DNA polymerase III epsilon subunit-like protein